MNRALWLQQQILSNNYTSGAELGVLRGPTFKFLIENCPNLNLIGVDVFIPDRYWKHNNLDLNSIKPLYWYDDLVKFADKYKPRAKIIRGFTNKVHQEIENNSLDFIFIDASHDKQSVIEDIENWEPKVKKGGLVSGHDINILDVKLAVNEMNMNYQEGPDNIWWWNK